jgi:phage shock protein C
MNDKRLYRSSTNKILCGICGGIAEYFGVDPTVVRAIYVILTFCTAFSGVLAYLILLLIIPERRNQIR